VLERTLGGILFFDAVYVNGMDRINAYIYTAIFFGIDNIGVGE
jgi:hypothetical protein